MRIKGEMELFRSINRMEQQAIECEATILELEELMNTHQCDYPEMFQTSLASVVDELLETQKELYELIAKRSTELRELKKEKAE